MILKQVEQFVQFCAEQHYKKTRNPYAVGVSGYFAEKEGFEPPDLLQSTVFKTAAFDHSAISPIKSALLPYCECKYINLFLATKIKSEKN